ncbi:MAG: LysR substrate-binding domain-containing protein, partial [Janthinobacterium lividum]
GSRPLPRTIDDLQAHRAVGYIEDMIYSPELDYLPLISQSLRPVFTSSNLLAQLQATLAGAGLCVLPCFMADCEPRLRRVLAGEVSLLRAFWLITHSDMLGLARIRAVADFITSAVSEAHRQFLPDRPLSVPPRPWLSEA